MKCIIRTIQNSFIAGLAVIFVSRLFAPVPASAQVIDFFLNVPSPTPSARPTAPATGTVPVTVTATATPSASVFPTGPVLTVTPLVTPQQRVRVIVGNAQNRGAFVDNALDITVVRDGKLLVAGGDYSRVQIGSAPAQLRQNLDAVNLETGTLYDWNPAPDGKVETISLDEATIFVGGLFTTIAGELRPYMAAFSRDTFELLPWTPAPDNYVFASHVDSTAVWIGGRFTAINGWPRSRIAMFTKPDYTLNGFNPGVNGDIFTMTGTDTTLYIGGEFTEVAGQPRRYLAAFDKNTGELQPWNPDAADPVRRLNVTDDNRIVASGITLREDGTAGRTFSLIDPVTGEVLSATIENSQGTPVPAATGNTGQTANVNAANNSLTQEIIVDQTALGFRIPNLADVLTFVIRIFFVIAGLVALVYLLLGAFAWITSGGDEDEVGAARKKIVAAIVGVILVVAVLAVVVALEQVVFRRAVCFGISCGATIPNLVEPITPVPSSASP
ncbi:MAG: hypothetical protein N2691_05160 [Patescibacteria group bacterium]|nr:hypothetical protein [Patescibacteria group bacterium]